MYITEEINETDHKDFIIHETFFFLKLIRYQSWETCIAVGQLILGADSFILEVKTCETHRWRSQETKKLKSK